MEKALTALLVLIVASCHSSFALPGEIDRKGGLCLPEFVGDYVEGDVQSARSVVSLQHFGIESGNVYIRVSGFAELGELKCHQPARLAEDPFKLTVLFTDENDAPMKMASVEVRESGVFDLTATAVWFHDGMERNLMVSDLDPVEQAVTLWTHQPSIAHCEDDLSDSKVVISGAELLFE